MKPTTYHLYHRDTLWFPFGQMIADPLPAATLGWPVRYRHVADLQVTSLEAAYALTQHLDQAWWLNPSVILHSESRSTSVGDVLIDAAGAAWAVAPLGFVQVASNPDGDPGSPEQVTKSVSPASSRKNTQKGDRNVSN